MLVNNLKLQGSVKVLGEMHVLPDGDTYALSEPSKNIYEDIFFAKALLVNIASLCTTVSLY